MTTSPSNVLKSLYIPAKVESKSLDGYVMLEDKAVVSFLNGKVIILNESLAPLYILRTNNVVGWISSRSIDTHRTNSRLLRKAIRLSSTDEYDIAMSTYCATITDRYWFKPKDSELSYKDVKFKSDKLSSIALDGKFIEVDKLEYHSPEFTNTGSFEKSWLLINGEWKLVKKSKPLEKFSELFVYRLGDCLKLNMARYVLDADRDDIILSEDFTNDGELIFEPMESLIGDVEDYIENVNLLYSLDKLLIRCKHEDLVMEYLDILFMDTICMNVDRHTQNYGFLRNSKDGLIESMAPNFDNNLSLVSRGINLSRGYSPSMLLDPFVEVLGHCSWYTIPRLCEEELLSIVVECNEECGTDIPVDYVVDLIINTYNYIVESSVNELRF